MRVCTAQEEHGGGKRLIRVRCRLRPSETLWAGSVVSAAGVAAAALCDPSAGVVLGTLLLIAAGAAWWRGRKLARQAVQIIAGVAEAMGMVRCEPTAVEPQKVLRAASVSERLTA